MSTEGIDPAEPIATALDAIHSRIARAARDFGRDARDVRLVCVTKTVPVEGIRAALTAGERVFGENRVQEAQAKWPALKAEYPDAELHLIGPLQSNKAAAAVALFDAIGTIDRLKIAEAVSAAMQRSGRRPKLYVEINTGNEPQKAGVAPEAADLFIEDCRSRLGLKIEGLMCIPPQLGLISPHFALLAAIARRNGITGLSMGMSADFELAIQLGATHVRVGSAIFGGRH